MSVDFRRRQAKILTPRQLAQQRLQLLYFDQFFIQSITLDQNIMLPALDNLALLNHNDLVRMLNCA